MNTEHEIVERLLDALYTSGHGQVWEILAEELGQLLEDVEISARYWVGLQWLDQVDRKLKREGVELPALLYLQVLIHAGGDDLDRTMLLPTGIQNVQAN